MIEIQPGHSYKDEHGTVWRNPVSVDSSEGQRWDLYTGTGPLTRRVRFDRHGHSGMSAVPNLIEDLGELEPVTTLVTELVSEDAPTAPATPVPLRGIIPGKLFPHDIFNEVLAETINTIQKLGQLKGGEYAGDEDRLANFRRNALEADTTMELIWRVYVSKHWDAIMQYEKDLRQGKSRSRLEGLAGRADDIIVYMILFKCMLIEAGVK